MFRILWDPSSGSIKRDSLKLLVMKFGPVVCVPAGTHTTGPNFTLPNTDYAHKTSQVISVNHV